MTDETTRADAARTGRRAMLAAVCVCALFFVSGAVGLVYEVVWKDVFTTVFGGTTAAVSVVISVFMGGLALGSYAFGRLADRARRHLRIYALLQLGIGVSALLVPPALGAAEGVYRAVFRAAESPALLRAVQVLVSAVILLVPTFLMGGTLPVLSRFLAGRRGAVGPAVGLLYGLNTLGAAAGAFLTGFVLIRALGMLRTTHMAAAANVALAVAFVVLDALAPPAGEHAAEAPAEGPAEEAPLGPWRRRLVLAAVAVSGFVAFSYEVLWTRLLTFRFETTVYAFSIMLATFLLGLGVGGTVVGALRPRRRVAYWRLYGYLEILVGITGLATVLLFFWARSGYTSFGQRVLGEFGWSAFVMLVPTALMGAAFPIACHLVAAGVKETGESVGSIYVLNTAGAVLGALLTGFVLVRALGTQRCVTAASALMVASGSLLLAALPGRKPFRARALRPVPVAWAVALAVWAVTPPGLLQDFFLKNLTVVMAHPDKEARLLGCAEGAEGVVVVCQVVGAERVIATGSTDVAGTGLTLRNTQKLQAHVPMLLHPNPRSVCQVGFGSGETAHLFTTYGLDRFDCVEISQAVIDMGAAHFTDINHGVVGSADLHAIVMDGAAYLKYTDRTYDVIANDSIWPNLAGNSALYTLEYFRNGRSHLNRGGIMTSWLPLEMPLRDFKTLLKTFSEAFPYVYVWNAVTHDNKHGLLIGCEEPLQVDISRFLERFDRYARQDLALVHLDDPAAFLAGHLASTDEMALDLEDVPLNTEDLPVLQFLGRRPEVFRIGRRRDMVENCLRLLAAYRDTISRHLTGFAGLPKADEWRSRIGLMERATSHILRGVSLQADEPAQSAHEFHVAWQLAPGHPAFLGDSGQANEPAAPTPAELATRSLDEVRALARDLLAREDSAGALAACQEWLRREPAAAEAHRGLGIYSLRLGRLDDALTHLSLAVREESDRPDTRLALGMALLQAGQPQAAIPHLETAARLDPQSARAHLQLGTADGLVGNVDAALEQLQQAVALNPSRPFAHANAALLLINQGRLSEALTHLKAWAELRPDSTQAHALLGGLYRRLGDERRAEQHLRRAAQLIALISEVGDQRPSSPNPQAPGEASREPDNP